MTGAVLVGIGAQASGGGVGVVLSPAPSWTSIFGFGSPSTNSQTLAGISTAITISASRTGAAILSYTQNGSVYLYTGAFTAHLGDVISWSVEASVIGTWQTGTITVLNVSNGSAVIGSISYAVKDSGY